MGGRTKKLKLNVDLGTEGAGDRIGLCNDVGELIGYIKLSDIIGAGGDFIPLSGTEVGKPITGTLKFQTSIGSLACDTDNSSSLDLSEGYSVLNANNLYLGNVNNVKNNIQIHDDGILITDITKGIGLVGNELYNKQNDPNAYPQLGDISAVSETIEEISRASLNSTYEDRPNGFQLICPNINLIYIKTSLTTWKPISMDPEFVIKDPLLYPAVTAVGSDVLIADYFLGTLEGRKMLNFKFLHRKKHEASTSTIIIKLFDNVTSVEIDLATSSAIANANRSWVTERQVSLDQGAGVLHTLTPTTTNNSDSASTNTPSVDITVSFANPLRLRVYALNSSLSSEIQQYSGLIKLA